VTRQAHRESRAQVLCESLPQCRAPVRLKMRRRYGYEILREIIGARPKAVSSMRANSASSPAQPVLIDLFFDEESQIARPARRLHRQADFAAEFESITRRKGKEQYDIVLYERGVRRSAAEIRRAGRPATGAKG